MAKVEVKVLMRYEDFLSLGGHQTNMHLFSEDTEARRVRIRHSGRKGETRYVLLPRDVTSQMRANSRAAAQVRDLGDKLVVFLVVEK